MQPFEFAVFVATALLLLRLVSGRPTYPLFAPTYLVPAGMALVLLGVSFEGSNATYKVLVS